MTIVQTPNPVLSSRAKPVGKISRKVLAVVNEMVDTLTNKDKPKGVGLAAPQIGIPLRIFITKPTQDAEIRVFIDPVILTKSQKLSELERPQNSATGKKTSDKKLEGCLSVQNVWGYIKRHSKLTLEYTAIDGQRQKEEFQGFMATIIQHECDHLEGILFTQRVLEQKGKLYRITKDEEGEEILEEIKV